MDSIFCANADGNLTSESWTLDGQAAIHGVVVASFLLVFELIGLPWNILVIVTIIREKLYHQPAVILLLNLLVADLFILLGPAPLLMTTGFSGEFILGSSDEVRCKWCKLSFVLLIPVYNSMFTVALMSLDRFFYIYTPFKYERNSTKYVSVITIIISTLCSIALGFTSQAVKDEFYFNPRLLICVGGNLDTGNIVVTVFLVMIGAVVLFVIVATNLSFSCIVFKHIRAVYSHDDVTTEKDMSKKQAYQCRLMKRMQSKRHQKQRRLCRMLFALLIIFIITLVPMIMLLLGTLLSSPAMTSSASYLVTVVLILHYSQVILNPILETSLITDIHHPMKAMLTCRKLRKKIESISEECEHTSLRTNKCSVWLAMFEVGHILSESGTDSTALSKKNGGFEVAL